MTCPTIGQKALTLDGLILILTEDYVSHVNLDHDEVSFSNHRNILQWEYELKREDKMNRRIPAYPLSVRLMYSKKVLYLLLFAIIIQQGSTWYGDVVLFIVLYL